MEGSITKSSKQGDSRYVRTYSLANTTWPRCTIFQPGAQVQIVSESVNAVEGETISFDNQGNGSEDGKAQPDAPFKVVNKSGQPATFGVNYFNIISSAPTSLFVSDILFHPISQYDKRNSPDPEFFHLLGVGNVLTLCSIPCPPPFSNSTWRATMKLPSNTKGANWLVKP